MRAEPYDPLGILQLEQQFLELRGGVEFWGVTETAYAVGATAKKSGNTDGLIAGVTKTTTAVENPNSKPDDTTKVNVTAKQNWYDRLVYVRQPAPYYVGILQAEERLRTREYLLAVAIIDTVLPQIHGPHRNLLLNMRQHLDWLARTYPR